MRSKSYTARSKQKAINFIAENGNSYGRDSIEYEETRFGDVDTHEHIPGDDEYRKVRALRVIERQHKRCRAAIIMLTH